MLKTKVSVTKKRPGNEEYSSDSYSATIELELPETVFTNGNGELRKNLSRLFKQVEDQVDCQLSTEKVDEGSEKKPQKKNTSKKTNGNSQATNKQIQFILGRLLRKNKMNMLQLKEHLDAVTGKEDVYQLTVKEASAVIESLK